MLEMLVLIVLSIALFYVAAWLLTRPVVAVPVVTVFAILYLPIIAAGYGFAWLFVRFCVLLASLIEWTDKTFGTTLAKRV
jgi:hypothetical protein